MNAKTSYLKSIGARIRSEANDLKRTPESLASELGMSNAIVGSVLAGTADLETAINLLRTMSEKYPISLANLWLDDDDTEEGVRLMTREASLASSRVFFRGDKEGNQKPYYEYRDTAMSRGAPFKPEWILELRCVDDASPDNRDVAFNNGHLMHQTTFFIGPVNFYWESGGRRHCAELNTGDSNYITPFVPHSFASRDPENLGLIIAVTFAGEVGRSAREFMAIGADSANRAAGDLRDQHIFMHRLGRHCQTESMHLDVLAARAISAGMEEDRIIAIFSGDLRPNHGDIDILSSILNIRPADLMVVPLAPHEEVVVCRSEPSQSRDFPSGNSPAYRMTDLARSRHQPQMKGFEVSVLGGERAYFEHCLHEYVFNYGEEAVTLFWEPEHSSTLGPGDSAYIRPLVRHGFDCAEGAGKGHLVIIRVPGSLNDNTLDEYASFATAGRDRVAGETRRWF